MRDTVLFDLDGTLLDTYEMILISMRYTVNEVEGKKHTDEELMAGVGTPLYDQMLHFVHSDVNRAEELTTIYRSYNDSIHDERVGAFPGTKEALEQLSNAGYRMGVVTSKRHWLAQRGLEISGIADFFDVLIGADDWDEHKTLIPVRFCMHASCSAPLPTNASMSAIARSISRRPTPLDARASQRFGECFPLRHSKHASLTCHAHRSRSLFAISWMKRHESQITPLHHLHRLV